MPPRPKKGEVLPRLSVEQILQADDLKELEVDVPEWGGSIKVRGLSKAAWEHYAEMEENGEEYLLSQALIDPVITVEEAAALRAKSVKAVARVEAAIMDVCGIGSAVADAERRFLTGATE